MHVMVAPLLSMGCHMVDMEMVVSERSEYYVADLCRHLFLTYICVPYYSGKVSWDPIFASLQKLCVIIINCTGAYFIGICMRHDQQLNFGCDFFVLFVKDDF